MKERVPTFKNGSNEFKIDDWTLEEEEVGGI